MTASSIPDVPAFADALAPLERAALGLQDELSIWEIATATYPEKADYQKREWLTDFLLQAIKAGRLAAYGNPDGWRCWQAKTDLPGSIPRFLQNPFPRCERHEPRPRFGPNTRDAMLGKLAGGFKRVASWEGVNSLIWRADYLAILATPAARGITAPDWWKAPQGEPATLHQGEPDRPEPGAAGTQNPATNRQCVADKARFLDLATWEGTQQATVNQHPEAARFKGKYDAPALLKWASEIDPRPKDQRGGRPRKS